MSNQAKALIVKQWLADWDNVKFDPNNRRKKPEKKFYVFQLPAKQLKKLADVHRRLADQPRAEDTGIQRKHTVERSEEISEFIQGGFPWSILSKAKRSSDDYKDLRMPGWLPTAIIANIKSPGTARRGKTLAVEDTISIAGEDAGIATLNFPENYMAEGWDPDSKPLEIIDGQHRLLAFDDDVEIEGDFEIPVVAFYDLDITWQAYLFYVINIKPKKINTSLAYDLYPILRIQDWLEKSPDGALIYRETRAQELTEILWSQEDSPWKNRINMLGESRSGKVTQAAFIRTLTSSFVKSWGGPNSKLGGLFGAPLDKLGDDILYWNRAQQGAFLVHSWEIIVSRVVECQEEWALNLRAIAEAKNEELNEADAAFASKFSLLSSDQGVRAISQVINDLCYVGVDQLNLHEWLYGFASEEFSLEEVTKAKDSLQGHSVTDFIKSLSDSIILFDWRTSATEGLPEEIRKGQGVYRGSSGYKELRRDLLLKIIDTGTPELKELAEEVKTILKY